MISVIVPARDEGAVIERLLATFTAHAASNELDVVVVCNGCSDNTAAIARKFPYSIRVIETHMADKIHALNLGDKAARAFPRIYLDADVLVTIFSVRALVSRLERGDVLAVAPTPRFETTDCSWVVKAFYRVRALLPSSSEGIGGSGVYALSKLGRNRFDEFPKVISDDGYIRIQFKPEERETLTNAVSTVFAPRTIGQLIAIKTRAHRGNIELSHRYPKNWKNKGTSNHWALLGLLKFPQLWPSVFIYIYVMTIARRNASIQSQSNISGWERDNSSREAPIHIRKKN